MSGRLSIVRKFGKPDVFNTFTRNPQWEEITSALLLDQTVSDRPDLIVRVFRLKLKELLSDLIKRQVLANHSHICISLSSKSVGYLAYTY